MRPQITKRLLMRFVRNKNSTRARWKWKKLQKQPLARGLHGPSKGAKKMGAVGGDTSHASGVPLLQVMQSHGHSMLLEGNSSVIRFTWEEC